MDAGVQISGPVGGISIGLVEDNQSGRFVCSTDIIGDEGTTWRQWTSSRRTSAG